MLEAAGEKKNSLKSFTFSTFHPFIILDFEMRPLSHYERSLRQREWQRSTSDNNGTAVGERFSRKVNTHDVRHRSSTSAAARNLGEISKEDALKVERDGRDARRFVRPHEGADERALVVPARVLHTDRSHKRRVDREDAHEVDRVHNGKIKTDR